MKTKNKAEKGFDNLNSSKNRNCIVEKIPWYLNNKKRVLIGPINPSVNNGIILNLTSLNWFILNIVFPSLQKK